MLPAPFREAMGYDWTEADQARFDLVMGAAGRVSTRLPGVVRRFPFNLCLWDVRRRIRRGRPLV
jgi:uncharacterized protein (DUF2236 family)